ncbi:MAG: hypothetical protein CTY25_05230 [Methylobacterium sp.]|nr:MAG: hypothetical protein CTY25_05230 [Methylobacterium sp.]
MTDVPITFAPSKPREPKKEPAMSYATKLDRPQRMKSRADQARLCRRITFVTACMLVPVVIGRRLMQPKNTPGPRNRTSVFMEARTEAGAIIPWIFMG